MQSIVHHRPLGREEKEAETSVDKGVQVNPVRAEHRRLPSQARGKSVKKRGTAGRIVAWKRLGLCSHAEPHWQSRQSGA